MTFMERLEPVVGLADVEEARVVQEDLLHDEGGDGLAQLGAVVHDPQAERDDLGGQEEVDHLPLVGLDQGADHPEGSEPQVLEGPGLAHRVEEGVEVEGDVGEQEGRPGVRVRGDTLQQGEGVTDSVALVSSQNGRVDGGVNVDNLLNSYNSEQ